LKKLPDRLSSSPAIVPRSVEVNAIILALFGLGFLLARFAAPIFALLPSCTFRTAFGFPCPSCGATRAGLALARGEWRAALAYNPLLVIGIGFLAWWSVAGLLKRGSGKAMTPNAFGKILDKIGMQADSVEFRRQLRWLALGAIALNWLYLILSE
jgi:hypothetical protein